MGSLSFVFQSVGGECRNWRIMSWWVPNLVRVMWDVFQQLRCDKTSHQDTNVDVIVVPTPTLARQHCRWCKLLEDDIYIPAHNDKTEEVVKNEKVSKKEIEFEGLGEKYEKIFYEEITYGETREREGRIDEKLQYAGGDEGWDGRVRGRHWRGRSSSRCRDRSRRCNYAEVWQVGFDDNGPHVDNGDGDTWRGQLRDNW